jgi:hypothetical protein
MARSAVTVANLLKYNTAYDITADAIDLANDHSIDITDIKDDLFMVMIENTSTLAGTATFVASAFNSESGQGDLVVTVGDSAIQVITLESARFKGSDGLLLIDMASTGALAGRIFASELPR